MVQGMKKKYVAPDILFESLALSTDISAGCAWISNQEPLACPINTDWGDTLIASGICSVIPGNEDQFCYHVPVADTNVFGS